jgi:hypothetical protein
VVISVESPKKKRKSVKKKSASKLKTKLDKTATLLHDGSPKIMVDDTA